MSGRLEHFGVHEKSDPNELTISIGSGASENVISGVRPSGERYVTANGGTMSNRGEKHFHMLTTEGHKCVRNMQVTDVKHTASGQITKFNQVDDVYRLKVSVAQPGFSGQRPQ